MATIDKQTFHIKAVEYGAMHLLDQPRRPVPEPEGATMLELSRLSKRFGSLQALDDLSLSLDRGEIVGFVGANGAGKSTTMRIVMGVLAADSGAVTWMGAPVDAAIRRTIGYMPEERGLYPRMKVAEQLVYLARLHGLSASSAKAAANQWTERLGLEERRGDEVQSLSLGNQQRVQLAAALVSDPELLILDEPTGGLDPLARSEMVDMLAQFMVEEGRTILFSTHITSDLDRLADYLVILSRGRVVANGTAEEIIDSFRLVRGIPEHLTDAVRQASLGLRSTSLGWEAMMPTDAAEALTDRIVVEVPTIEDLAVHIAKEAGRE